MGVPRVSLEPLGAPFILAAFSLRSGRVAVVYLFGHCCAKGGSSGRAAHRSLQVGVLSQGLWPERLPVREVVGVLSRRGKLPPALIGAGRFLSRRSTGNLSVTASTKLWCRCGMPLPLSSVCQQASGPTPPGPLSMCESSRTTGGQIFVKVWGGSGGKRSWLWWCGVAAGAAGSSFWWISSVSTWGKFGRGWSSSVCDLTIQHCGGVQGAL